MKQLSAILLTFSMFITNINITLATHYCGDKVVETAFAFGNEEIGCGMEEMEKECNNFSSPSASPKNCCQNEYTQIGLQNDLTTPKIITNSVNFNFVVAFINVSFQTDAFDASAKATSISHPPPLLQLDIPILFQSFRI